MKDLQEFANLIEVHDIAGISAAFANGLDPNSSFNNEPLIYELTSEYTRSPAFKSIVKVFVDYGLQFEDTALLAVLLDDATVLEQELKNDPGLIHRKYNLRCAYTPLFEASLLHICAEFNHGATAEVLLKHGMNVDVKAGIDENGFGGQTPVFHTVNQNGHQSEALLDYLMRKGADLKITLPGLIWGKGYDWETLIPAVNPISYAMMGLLPQMHRNERTQSEIVTRLLKQSYGIDYHPENVPCKYLKP
ncbi:hypothetical protein SAMN05421820_10719 [Pedobacter steynii]|uniref:Uncharacterized protein n=1 Tax=Pedobacter steynii TaxID=430522 RepID=A0A1H0A7N4_9SPHI|nr:ankyrin repeat domain-containing protein [Pedobacter steynii]NQX41435.1 ankyrin repeat domain-containing protein [Pedobacter steynii]SDN29550.1 hypothetical protein SAMN05421820_10719 [Pedobacter steynii]